ncbi:MAG: dihydrolipoamide acetyltransferase family protein [Pseudomonadota bacterium]
MPVEIVMPKLGLTMTEGTIVEWKKREGDPVKKGDVLFVLQTEKVTFEVESPEDGILGKVLVEEKETVPVGAIVAYLLKPGEDMAVLKAAASVSEGLRARETGEKTGQPPPEQETIPPVEANAGEEVRIKASPLARKMAREYNLDLSAITGTGPGGRITKEDVEKAHEEGPREAVPVPVPEKEVPAQRLVPFRGMRQTIAKRMLAAKVETAQTYMSNTVDATRITEYRKSLLPHIQEKSGVKITITDIMMKITGAAIREHPIMNTRWTHEGVLYLEDVHMGMAMALDDGLIVPVIRDINKKGLARIALDRVELIRKGKEKSFLPDDITGSTFTLSAMGMFGIEHFTANINLPENAILAVGAIIDKPVAVDGQVVIRPMMNVTLTYDHRTIDGAEAGKFMRTLKTLMENPILILA